uniref:Ubiquitin carboxyl-terminal hydrolase 1 n=1 Tax=Lygus hesperus TaxID=30085 RepID=A0A0A9YMR4_LYGHE
MGNTCYFNSGVQLLANCPAFVYCCRHNPCLILQKRYAGANCDLDGNSKNGPNGRGDVCYRVISSHETSPSEGLLSALARMLYFMEHGLPESVTYGGIRNYYNSGNRSSDAPIGPVEVLNALREVCPMFDGWQQQDCMEMLNAVLATIEDVGGLKINI